MDEMFKKATNNMINTINSLSEKDREYLLNYEPCVNRGFAWDTESEYSRIKNILSIKTDRDGHSGASFSICLRSAIETLESLTVVYAEECEILNPVNQFDLEIL